MSKNYEFERQVLRKGFDGETCFVNPWCGVWPDGKHAVMTMQKLLLSGSDVFFGAHAAYSVDGGRNFSDFEPVESMGRHREKQGRESCVNDLKPQWHSATEKMLGIGTRVFYSDDGKPDHVRGGFPPQAVYSTCDLTTRQWSPPRKLELSQELDKYPHVVAGSVQRYDMANGRILLPLSCKPAESPARDTIVAEFEFDGDTMRMVKCGQPLCLPVERGLYEPSITRVGERFLLTLRNDNTAYAAVSVDGLNFSEPQRWRFDDGEELGSYNTQQHWVTSGNRVWLIYTRKGLDNDHVFRHRAPLLIGEVDVDTLTVIRDSEEVLVPERGARLGNFGVTHVDDGEVWVTAAEWMQPVGCEKYGSDNSVYISRIKF